MIACPFYVPTFKYSSAFSPRIMKCIFCYDTRLKVGRPPACVEACPQEALIFGKRADLLDIARKRITNNSSKYVNHIYGEKEAGGTAWLYISPVEFSKVGFNTHISQEPIINFVRDFLSMVPMVLMIWPALFAGFHLLANRKDANSRHDNDHQEV